MKKATISILLVVITVVLIALAFDWGRSEVKAPELNNNASTTESFNKNSSSTPELPIVVKNIKDNQEISSPLVIMGSARGYWFFEASFPIQLVDANGNILATAIAQAQSEWMTTDFVDFVATLEYIKPTSTKHALLVLNKDNPSGDPGLDQSIFIPVILK